MRVDDEDEMRGDCDRNEDGSHDSLVFLAAHHLVALLHRSNLHVVELVILFHILARIFHRVFILHYLIHLKVTEEDGRDLEHDVRVEEELAVRCAVAVDHVEEERHAHQRHHHSDRVEVLELLQKAEAHERAEDHHAPVNRDVQAALLNLHFIIIQFI